MHANCNNACQWFTDLHGVVCVSWPFCSHVLPLVHVHVLIIWAKAFPCCIHALLTCCPQLLRCYILQRTQDRESVEAVILAVIVYCLMMCDSVRHSKTVIWPPVGIRIWRYLQDSHEGTASSCSAPSGSTLDSFCLSWPGRGESSGGCINMQHICVISVLIGEPCTLHVHTTAPMLCILDG